MPFVRTPAPLYAFVQRLRRVPMEALVWTAGLTALGLTDPAAPGLLELCLAKAAGLPGCPGCGLGHAVAHLLDGQWAASWEAHPLGLPALGLLTARIVRLARPIFAPSVVPPPYRPDV